MISKVIISEVFNVSRSAVTQSSKTNERSADEETSYRIAKYLFGTTNRLNINRNIRQLTNKFLTIISARREVCTGKGRPKQQADFKIIRRLIRQIYKEFCKIFDISTDNPSITTIYTRIALKSTLNSFTIYYKLPC